MEGQVFISYVREDSDAVDRVEAFLTAAGVSVWRDKTSLLPGEYWDTAIQAAVEDHALVFVACFSSNSQARPNNGQLEELEYAARHLRKDPRAEPWLIPIRLDECEMPTLDLGGGRTLKSIHGLDLFESSWEIGAARLLRSILRILGRATPETGGAKAVTSPGPLNAQRTHLTVPLSVARSELEELVARGQALLSSPIPAGRRAVQWYDEVVMWFRQRLSDDHLAEFAERRREPLHTQEHFLLAGLDQITALLNQLHLYDSDPVSGSPR